MVVASGLRDSASQVFCRGQLTLASFSIAVRIRIPKSLAHKVVQFSTLISRAQPTLQLPCISPQSPVTCNGEYRRPVIKAQPSFHHVDAENGERKLYVI